MDDFTKESLEVLLNQRVKIEANGSLYVGELISIHEGELVLKGRKYRKQAKSTNILHISIPLDDIDAIIVPSHSKNVSY